MRTRSLTGDSETGAVGSGTLMFYDAVYSSAIAIAGAIIFLFVDRLEPNRAVAHLLKFLVLFVSSIIIMQRLSSLF
jgi:hypothetical protein